MTPFPYYVIEDYVQDKEFLSQILHDFKKVTVTKHWWKYDNPFEKKLAFDKIDEMPPALQLLFEMLNSSDTITMLEHLTGIEGLLPDPGYRGGGLHRIQPGGYLHIHEDFNIHPKLKLKRKLNLILYLNEEWEREWGGALELWAKDMSKKEVEIWPILNRAVVFDTSDHAYHGHPDPITGPKERWSIAVYYYVANDANETPHSTLYQKRPQDMTNPELENLREIRGRGRLPQG